VAPHDSVGSNLYVHTRRGQVMRVVPRENEDVNEVWLSDRDRFSYEGLYSEERLTAPMVKVDGEWQAVDWESGLQAAADGMRRIIDRHGAEQFGVLVSPAATLEEMLLLQALARGVGVNNIDHRLRQADFADQEQAPLFPSLGQSLAALESVDAALVIGANVRKEQPLAGHRLRKAALAGARVMFINPVDYEFLFAAHARAVVPPSRMVETLAGVAACYPKAGGKASDEVRSVIVAVTPDETMRAMAVALGEAANATILLGNIAAAHPQYSLLKALAAVVAEATGATLGLLPEAANSVGGWLAGALPHRGPAGSSVAAKGLAARDMLEHPRKGYLLFGLEPGHDCWDAATATAAVNGAEFVLSMTPYASEELRTAADVLLPIVPFTETSGTFVNAEGRWQSFAGVASPQGESRPGWKVLRVLANQFGLDGFDQASSEELRDELRSRVGQPEPDNSQPAGPVTLPAAINGLERIGDVPIHSVDALVRRAPSLQATPDAADTGCVRLNAGQAEQSGVSDGDRVIVRQGNASSTLEVRVDGRVPDGCVWLPAGTDAAAQLGASFGAIDIERCE
jgi:NADH-quinone oxidoreductase subunit G